MKELGIKTTDALMDEFGLAGVKRYLTYSQIQNIINTVMQYQTWAERQTIIDEMVICYTTDLTQEEVEEKTMDYFVQCGLVDYLHYTVENYFDIFEGLKYHESVGKALMELSKNIPQIKEAIMSELQK